mmetsp:Transcript_9059/g.27222  ORF Transcript_9059/g.27222 Transcript_9059/m.27222 type:complete len:132 (+) Transcript_9059:272-667(+)
MRVRRERELSRLWKWTRLRTFDRRSRGSLFSYEDLSIMTEELFFHQGVRPDYSLLLSSVSTAGTRVGTCIVCLDMVGEGDRFIELECSHRFHWSCLAPWLADHSKCPTCRREIGLPWGCTNGFLARSVVRN